MTKQTSTLNPPKKSKKIAGNILFSTLINVTSAVAVSFLLSSCTIGAGGVVFGMQDIQDSYTRRLQVVKLIEKGDQLSDRDRAELTTLINSLK